MRSPPYERFAAWEVSHELALAVHETTKKFPDDERYRLTAQARRASFSIPANIAEGAGRRGPGEFRRFLDISLGSVSELTYILRFARDVKILSPETWQELEQLRQRAGALTWRLYKAVSAASSRRSREKG